jgi:hypothetical protein
MLYFSISCIIFIATTTTANSNNTSSFDQPPNHSIWTISTGRSIAVDTENHIEPNELLLPTPIIVMGLPKAGTTSIGMFFACGFGSKHQHRVSHYDCHVKKSRLEYQNHGAGKACGTVMYNNMVTPTRPRPASIFHQIDFFDVYSEIDMIQSKVVVLPQVMFITDIYDAYPNATWILNLRDPIEWLQSIDNSGLRSKFVQSRIFHRKFGELKKAGVGGRDEEMYDFYHVQGQFVRDFVNIHPSIHLVEVEIDKADAGERMEGLFGIHKECWSKSNKAI